PHRTSSPKRERNSLTVMMDFRFNRLGFFMSDIISPFVRLFKLDIHLVLLTRVFRCLGFLGWAAWYSLVASMMRWKCSGPLVQVNGVGFWLYFFKYRSRKSFNSFFERWTLWVSACLVRMLKKHSIMFIHE